MGLKGDVYTATERIPYVTKHLSIQFLQDISNNRDGEFSSLVRKFDLLGASSS